MKNVYLYAGLLSVCVCCFIPLPLFHVCIKFVFDFFLLRPLQPTLHTVKRK